MSTKPTASALRELLLEVLPKETSNFGVAPVLKFTHLPPSHAKALHPDAMLVVGMRGAGKSFWSAALQDPSHRALLAQRSPHLGVNERTQVLVGFSQEPDPDRYPGANMLAQLLEQGSDPSAIWRAVVVRALAPKLLPAKNSWKHWIDYVASHPDDIERLLVQQDRALRDRDETLLIVFDALDRSARNWNDMHRLIRGLLMEALYFRSFRRLRLKLFLRTDQIANASVTDFVDASKVLSSKVELSWAPRDLYNLLWQHLLNGEESSFRELVNERLRTPATTMFIGGQKVFAPSRAMTQDDEVQRELFHSLTGPWMGRDRRRGFPFTWVPGHLADAQGRTSPRSFLAALQSAAEASEVRSPAPEHALHFDDIKRGVQRASTIRVDEIKEDYPWVDSLLGALNGLVVPCEFEKVRKVWEPANGPLTQLKRSVSKGEQRLPPSRLDQGAEGVRRDLEELGLFIRLRDGRLHIPDVFRVGYGLGRRGGVKPLPRDAS